MDIPSLSNYMNDPTKHGGQQFKRFKKAREENKKKPAVAEIAYPDSTFDVKA